MFLVRGGGLVPPPAEGAILPGVLRARVEGLADERGRVPARVLPDRPPGPGFAHRAPRGILAP